MLGAKYCGTTSLTYPKGRPLSTTWLQSRAVSKIFFGGETKLIFSGRGVQKIKKGIKMLFLFILLRLYESDKHFGGDSRPPPWIRLSLYLRTPHIPLSSSTHGRHHLAYVISESGHPLENAEKFKF